MPRGDRTGPLGQGPGTGHRQNHCRPENASSTPRFGRGSGRGRNGLGPSRYALDDKEQLAREKVLLEERIKIIEQRLTQE